MFLSCCLFLVLSLEMDLGNGQMMVSSVWIDAVYSSAAFPAPTPFPSPTPVSQVHFQFGEDAGDKLADLSDHDDCSDALKLDSGPVPIFDEHISSFHVCSNGIISGKKPFTSPVPRFFPGNTTEQDKILFAPYWADIDLGQEGKIWYQLHLRADNITHKADSIVHGISGYYNEFESSIVAVVTWEDVQNFPAENRSIYKDEFSGLENTFQAAIVSDGTDTFLLYIYIDIEWSGRWGKDHIAVVGYNAGDGKNYYNLPGSKTEGIADIDDNSMEPGNFTGVFLFHLTPSSNSSNRSRAAFKCHQWHYLDLLRFGNEPVWTQYLSPVPSSFEQALRDQRYLEIKSLHGDRCFIQKISRSVDIDGDLLSPTTLSCYGDRGELNLAASTSSPYHPTTLHLKGYHEPHEHEQHEDPFTFCCLHSKLCHLYKERRPAMSADKYRPLFQGWSFGDPHVRTIDGRVYTFNGHGEYILLKTRSNSFVLEGRAEPIGDANGTVFTAFSMAEFPPGSNFTDGYDNITIIHVQLTDNDLLQVWTLGGNHTNWTDVTRSASESLFLEGVVLSQLNNKTLVALFSQQIAVKVEAKTALLTVVVSSPDKLMGATSGLLGVWDDNPENDFLARNGTTLPDDSTDKHKHVDFGQTWQITVEESLFYYADGLGPDDFLFPNYEPLYRDELNFTNLASPAVISACGGDRLCLFDGSMTGNIEIAVQTLQTQEQNEADLTYLRNNAPVIKGNDTLFAITNKTSSYHFSVSDVNNDTFNVTFHANQKDTPDGYSLEETSNGFYQFTWTPKSTQPVKIAFLATDSHGASSVLQPLIQLCACRLDLGATCIEGHYKHKDDDDHKDDDHKHDNDHKDDGKHKDNDDHNFIVQECKCGSGYTGRDCSEDFDGCSKQNCFPGVTCTDNIAPRDGATCGSCPGGTKSYEGTCIDINECNSKSNNSCEQICVNTLGSYSCECNKGFTLNNDGQSCTDVNECNIGFPCHQICNNTEGSFNCSCYFGFELDDDGVTCNPTSNCMSLTCEHLCTIGRSGEECFCNRGYALDRNNINCTDINECLSNVCDESCTNTEGSFACSCPEGYRLKDDRISCEDVDECASLSSRCQNTNEICYNTLGSFVCACPPRTSLVDGRCEVLTPTRPPPPAVNGTDRGLVLITVANMTVAQFRTMETQFKSFVGFAVTNHCSIVIDDCTDDSGTREAKRSVFVVDGNNVKIETLVQDGQNVNVTFYVIGPGGRFVVPAPEVVKSLRSDAAQTFLQAIGITLLYIAPVYPVPTDQPTSVPPTKDSGLSTAELVGIICGSIGGVVLILLVIGVIYFLLQSKQTSKVNPMANNKEVDSVPLRQVKSSTSTLQSVNSRGSVTSPIFET